MSCPASSGSRRGGACWRARRSSPVPYSAFARGTEYVGNAYTYLDMTALGRQEDWEEPKGRASGIAPVRGGDPTFTS